MKTTLTAIAAGILAAFLILSPVMASAQTTYTLSVSVSPSTLTGVATGTITGTVSPAPGSGTSAALTITNPSGTQVFTGTSEVSASGALTSTTFTSGGNNWATGTYTVTATWSPSINVTPITATAQFSYTCVSDCGSQSGSTTTITVVGDSNSVIFAGQTAQIYALAYWNNGSAAAHATWTVAVLGPSGSAPSPAISWTQSSPQSGVALWTGSIPTGSGDGVYAVEISATEGGITGWTQTAFTVDSELNYASQLSSISSSLSSLSTSVTGSLSSLTTTVGALNGTIASLSSTLGTVNSNVQALGTSISGLSSTVNTINSDITGITSSISTLTNDVTTMQSTVQGLSGLTTAVNNLQSSVSSLSTSVSNAQTYILVVAVLAVITLVLELAVLIRKMS